MLKLLKLKNKKGQMEFDETTIIGLIAGLIGGFISVIVTAKMGGGAFLKIASFLLTGAVCFFIAQKLSDD